MFNIRMKVDEFLIENVCPEDVEFLHNWINEQNFKCDMKLKLGDYSETYESFLESYLSENEFFLKIMKEEKFLGIIKGRIEFVNPSEVWIMHFIIDQNFRGLNIGSQVITHLMKFFIEKFGMKYFYTMTNKMDENMLNFWKRNQFNILRYESTSINKPNMVILGKR